jgi:uncharacterized membrane protein
MTGDTTIVAGIEIPSVSPVFLTVVGIHVLLGIACVITGLIAMLSEKRPGRHPKFGTIYFWFLSAVFATATFLSAMRWAEDYHLFHSRSAFFHCSVSWADGAPARLHQVAHYGHGPLIHTAADGFLCG